MEKKKRWNKDYSVIIALTEFMCYLYMYFIIFNAGCQGEFQSFSLLNVNNITAYSIAHYL